MEMNRAGPSSLGMRVASGAFWIALEMVAVQGLSLVVFSILAHLVAPRDFGLVAISFAFIYSLKLLAIDQATIPIIRKPDPSNLDWTTAFWITVTFGMLTALLLCGFSFVTDDLFHTHGLGAVIRPMSLILVSLSLSRTQEAWLTRHFQLRVLAIRSIIGMLLGAGAGIITALMGFGVWALVIQQMIASFSALALLWLTTPWRPGMQFCRESSRYILSYLQRMSGGVLLAVVNQNIDTALIAVFFGPSFVGVYSVAKRLNLAVQVIAVNPINGVALPALAEAHGNSARQQQVFMMATRLAFACCTPIFLGAAAIASPVIALLFGARWVGAASIFSWLSVGALCSLAFGHFGNVLLVQNQPTWLTALAGIQTALSIGLFVLLHAIGAQTIAAPFVLPYILTVPLCGILALRLLKVSWYQWIETIGPPIIAAGVMLIGIGLLTPSLASIPVVLKLAVLGMTGATIYGLCMVGLARDTLMTGIKLLRLRKVR